MAMNYYQPQYGNPYYNGIPQYQQPQPMSTQQIPMIYGKIVDGVDVVRGIDVPIGSSFILPKADGSSIYSKGWNNDGTTFVKEYKLVEEQSEKIPTIDWNEKLNDIYDSIDSLSRKIDKIKISSSPTSTSPMKKRKVGEEDE